MSARVSKEISVSFDSPVVVCTAQRLIEIERKIHFDANRLLVSGAFLLTEYNYLQELVFRGIQFIVKFLAFGFRRVNTPLSRPLRLIYTYPQTQEALRSFGQISKYPRKRFPNLECRRSSAFFLLAMSLHRG